MWINWSPSWPSLWGHTHARDAVAQVQLYLNEVTSATPVSVDTTRPYRLTVPKELLRSRSPGAASIPGGNGL